MDSQFQLVWMFNQSLNRWMLAERILEISETNRVKLRFNSKTDVNSKIISPLDQPDPGQFTSIIVSSNEVFPVHPSHFEGIDDLSLMQSVHEGPILNTLKNRWHDKNMYTLCDDILIAINPKRTTDMLHKYHLKYLNVNHSEVEEFDVKPHVFSLANHALHGMIDKIDQSIVVTGDSGSGKTSIAKHLIDFLLIANHHLQMSFTDVDSADFFPTVIKNKVIDTQRVLQTFCNVKTSRNNNSSRYGCYTKLYYDRFHNISSFSNEIIFVETSRIAQLKENERNYHVFYIIIQGIKLEEIDLNKKLQLHSIDSFAILFSQRNVKLLIASQFSELEENNQRFSTLCSELIGIGCSRDEITQIWTILAVVLHLGNLNILQDLKIQSNGHSTMEMVADLLAVDFLSLQKALTTITIRLGDNYKKTSPRKSLMFESETDIEETSGGCEQNIRALMSYLYHRVVSWIISKSNNPSLTSPVNESPLTSIGILDMISFNDDVDSPNSFEQLIENYAFERINSLCKILIFDREQALWLDEGLAWTKIENNASSNATLDLFEGLFSAIYQGLDSTMSGSECSHCLKRTFQMHDALIVGSGSGRSPVMHLGSSPASAVIFTIKHFIGQITYKISEFSQKGTLKIVSKNLMDVLNLSACSLVREIILVDKNYDTQQSLTQSTIIIEGSQRGLSNCPSCLIQTMDHFIEKLDSSNVRFIQCINPNHDKSSENFSIPLVRKQLHTHNLITIAKLKTTGYPIKMSFEEFCRRFEKLYGSETSVFVNDIDKSTAIATSWLPVGSYLIGNTKIFMSKVGFKIMLSFLRNLCTGFAVLVQRLYRGHTGRMTARASFVAILAIQKFVKRLKAIRLRRQAEALVTKRLNSIITIQSFGRMIISRNIYESATYAIVVVQSWTRTWRLRRKYLLIKRMTARLQHFARQIVARQRLDQLFFHIFTLQSFFRMNIARRKVQKRIAERRIQRFFCTFVRNQTASDLIQVVHQSLRSGDLEMTRDLLAQYPHFFKSRNRYKCYETALHSAMYSRSIEILLIIQPTPWDILTKDSSGLSSIHHTVLGGCDVDVAKLLWKRLKPLAFQSELFSTRGAGVSSDGIWYWNEYLRSKSKESTKCSKAKSSISFSNISKKISEGESKRYLKMGLLNGLGMNVGWVVLTESHLLCYNSERDVDNMPPKLVPLLGCDVKRASDNKRLFSINQRGTLHKFIAESEVDLIEWITLINAVSGIALSCDVWNYNRSNLIPENSHLLSYTDLLEVWIRERTKKNQETALHLIARNYEDEVARGIFTEERQVQAMVFAAWLVDHGCPTTATNHEGLTAAKLAAGVGFYELAMFLDAYDAVPRCRFPPKLLGFSYLDMSVSFIADINITASNITYDKLRQPHLSITAFNLAGDIIEECVQLRIMALQKAPFLWWEQSYSMKTPLEMLDEGSYLLIEFLALSGSSFQKTKKSFKSSKYLGEISPKLNGLREITDSIEDLDVKTPSKPSVYGLISWHRFNINLQELKSNDLKLTMKQPPVSNIGTTPDHNSCLKAEVCITRKLPCFDFEKLRNLSS